MPFSRGGWLLFLETTWENSSVLILSCMAQCPSKDCSLACHFWNTYKMEGSMMIKEVKAVLVSLATFYLVVEGPSSMLR
jgi:hypothetical protein